MTDELKNLCTSVIFNLTEKDNNQFDSHDVIACLDEQQNANILLTNLWGMVNPEIQAEIRHNLHREIGRWIERNQSSLGIEFVEKHNSPNYHGDDTLNAIWRKK